MSESELEYNSDDSNGTSNSSQFELRYTESTEGESQSDASSQSPFLQSNSSLASRNDTDNLESNQESESRTTSNSLPESIVIAELPNENLVTNQSIDQELPETQEEPVQVLNQTITIDAPCSQVEVVDLDSESDPLPSSLPPTLSSASSLSNNNNSNHNPVVINVDEEEDVMILSDSDVLHMPIVIPSSPLHPAELPTAPSYVFPPQARFNHYRRNAGNYQHLFAAASSTPAELQARLKRSSTSSRFSKKIKPCEEQTSTSTKETETTEPSKPAVQCPICLDDIQTISTSQRQLLSTVCGHVFCDSCLKTSFKVKKECPHCRRKLTVKQYHPIFL